MLRRPYFIRSFRRTAASAYRGGARAPIGGEDIEQRAAIAMTYEYVGASRVGAECRRATLVAAPTDRAHGNIVNSADRDRLRDTGRGGDAEVVTIVARGGEDGDTGRTEVRDRDCGGARRAGRDARSRILNLLPIQ